LYIASFFYLATVKADAPEGVRLLGAGARVPSDVKKMALFSPRAFPFFFFSKRGIFLPSLSAKGWFPPFPDALLHFSSPFQQAEWTFSFGGMKLSRDSPLSLSFSLSFFLSPL